MMNTWQLTIPESLQVQGHCKGPLGRKSHGRSGSDGRG